MRTGKRYSILVAVVVAVPLAVAVTSSGAAAAGGDTVTFVNNSGQTLWIGSGQNADGSAAIGDLPTLADGQSASVTIPDGGDPAHWRGRFFARQLCSGDPGISFHCEVGDCGRYADHCEQVNQPASLAEFNFDHADGLAPWYDVSYVDGMSLPVTIAPQGDSAAVAGGCAAADCSGTRLLDQCPLDDVVYDQQTGAKLMCANPTPEEQSSYTQALDADMPLAYLWSGADGVPGNQVVFNCGGCTSFVVTFGGKAGGDQQQAAEDPQDAFTRSIPPVHSFHGLADKCIDVPGGRSDDGARLQLWDCNDTPAQIFTQGTNGTQMILGKCMDVAWAATDDGAKVQLAWCNGGPAQVWELYQGGLRNPNSGKCVDVRDADTDDGAPLQIWDCLQAPNQMWDPVLAGA